MSTPISQRSKLEGLELYAPRRAAARPAPEYDDASSPTAPEQPAYQQPDIADDDRQPSEMATHEMGAQEAAAMDAAHAQLEEAIQAAIDAGRSRDEPRAAEVRLPPAANLRTPPFAERPMSPADLLPPARHVAQSRPPQRPRLTPDLVPEPPIDPQRRSFVGLTIRYGLAVGFAALVAYGVTMMSSSQGDHAWTRHASVSAVAVAPEPQSEPSPSRLIVEDQQAFANEPLPLGVAVDNAKKNELLQLAGLAEGSRLSAGVRTGASSWQLPLHELKNLYLYAPAGFVGVMNTDVDLLAADKRVIDRRGVRLEWLAKKTEPSQPVDLPAKSPAAAVAVPGMDPQQATTLMQRGQDFLKSGDIEAARIVFKRLADAGIADGALAAASTYDSRYLAAHNVVGVRGDETKARALYQRAMELGSADAGRLLAQMATK